MSKLNQQLLNNQSQKNRFWTFINKEATENEPAGVELRIDGDILDDNQAWIYEWLGMDVVSPNAFRSELKQYAGQDIILWVDSRGGSVFAATGIYVALMEHKQNGAKITGKVTRAMSAATVPLMACTEILMSPPGLIMIHNPITDVQGYASDMRKAADVLDIIKDTIINAYVSKTGRPRNKIAAMMDDETYMSANVAVREGFADGILYQDQAAELENVMNFSYNHLAVQNSMVESMQKFMKIAELAEAKAKNESTLPGKKTDKPPVDPDVDIKNKEEHVMEIKNVTDLETQLPDIHKQVLNTGVTAGATAERERLKAFDVLAGKVDPDFLAAAKYEDGATAERVLFKAMQEGKMIDASYVAKAALDAAAANMVPGASSDNTKPDEVTGVLNRVKMVAKKTLGMEGGSK